MCASAHPLPQSVPLHVRIYCAEGKLQNHPILMAFPEKTGLIPHHISTTDQQDLANGLLLQPRHHPATDLHISVTVATSQPPPAL